MDRGEYWGKGVATKAPLWFLDHVAVRHPLHATVAERNSGSIRVLEKCGFAGLGEEEGGVHLSADG